MFYRLSIPIIGFIIAHSICQAQSQYLYLTNSLSTLKIIQNLTNPTSNCPQPQKTCHPFYQKIADPLNKGAILSGLDYLNKVSSTEQICALGSLADREFTPEQEEYYFELNSPYFHCPDSRVKSFIYYSLKSQFLFAKELMQKKLIAHSQLDGPPDCSSYAYSPSLYEFCQQEKVCLTTPNIESSERAYLDYQKIEQAIVEFQKKRKQLKTQLKMNRSGDNIQKKKKIAAIEQGLHFLTQKKELHYQTHPWFKSNRFHRLAKKFNYKNAHKKFFKNQLNQVNEQEKGVQQNILCLINPDEYDCDTSSIQKITTEMSSETLSSSPFYHSFQCVVQRNAEIAQMNSHLNRTAIDLVLTPATGLLSLLSKAKKIKRGAQMALLANFGINSMFTLESLGEVKTCFKQRETLRSALIQESTCSTLNTQQMQAYENLKNCYSQIAFATVDGLLSALGLHGLSQLLPKPAAIIENSIAQDIGIDLSLMKKTPEDLDNFVLRFDYISRPMTLKDAPPKVKQVIWGYYQDIHNPQKINDYFDKLFDEATKLAKQSSDPKVKTILGQGSIPTEFIEAALVKRFNQQGHTVRPMNTVNEEDFVNQLREGPFVDYGFDNEFSVIDPTEPLHGHLSHLIQLDYLSPHLNKNDITLTQFTNVLADDIEAFDSKTESIWFTFFDQNLESFSLTSQFGNPERLHSVVASRTTPLRYRGYSQAFKDQFINSEWKKRIEDISRLTGRAAKRKEVNSYEELLEQPFFKIGSETRLKLNIDDERVKKSLVEIYNRLLNTKEYEDYFKNLLEEALIRVNNPSHKFHQDYLEGRINQEVFAEILNTRFHSRDLTIGHVVGTTTDHFGSILRNGPFIDVTMSAPKNAHGAYSHLIQLDYIHDILAKHFGSDVSDFYQFLGSEQGLNVFGLFFDNISPETASHIMKPAGVNSALRVLDGSKNINEFVSN